MTLNILSLRTLFMLALIMSPLAAQAEPLDLVTADGKKITLQIEIADTDDEREQGLMNRDVLAPDAGMLFIFDEVKTPYFWMRKTRIALDMVFVGADGLVKGVHANAKPYDLTPISSSEPVLAVLEIGGGKAETLGISTGTKVIHKVFEKGLK